MISLLLPHKSIQWLSKVPTSSDSDQKTTDGYIIPPSLYVTPNEEEDQFEEIDPISGILKKVVNVIEHPQTTEETTNTHEHQQESNHEEIKGEVLDEPLQWVEIEAIVTKSRFVGEVSFDPSILTSSRKASTTTENDIPINVKTVDPIVEED